MYDHVITDKLDKKIHKLRKKSKKQVENEPIGILIHDKTITEDQKKIFELLWVVAK